jgi:hypothetical protein
MNKKNIPEIIKDLTEINRRLSYNLWNVSFFGEKPSGLSPRLIFPKKRKKNKKDEDIKRISEQEARILYCNILNNLNYFYSIETPTDNTYIQSGKTGVSALSDLSIYRCTDKGFKKEANVEFKAHNPVIKDISKDFEKIIKEKEHGNWFHILENINKGTLPSVFDKFIFSLKEHSNKGSKISILFCICILEKKFSIIKYFKWNKNVGDLIHYLDKFFVLRQTKNRNINEQKELLRDSKWLIVEL